MALESCYPTLAPAGSCVRPLNLRPSKQPHSHWRTAPIIDRFARASHSRIRAGASRIYSVMKVLVIAATGLLNGLCCTRRSPGGPRFAPSGAQTLQIVS